MRYIVKLPERFEEKSSLAEYLEDVDNGGFNMACYEVMGVYFRSLRLEPTACEAVQKEIFTIFRDVYSCATVVKHQRYTEEWGQQKNGHYLLPDGTEFTKFTQHKNLPLYMALLWWVINLTEPTGEKQFERVREKLLHCIREKFVSEVSEKPVFQLFDNALGATAQQAEEAICRIAPLLTGKAQWRGVITELSLIVSYCEKIDEEHPHRGGQHEKQRDKFMVEDIERLTGRKKLYESVKKPDSNAYPHVQVLFRKLLSEICQGELTI